MPGTRVSVEVSPAAIARRTVSGLCTARIAWASRGPTPLAVCSSSNSSRASSSTNPYSVSESSRTTRLVARRASAPTRRPASVPGAHATAMPTPPTSITAPSGDTAATRPRTLAIIGPPPNRGLEPGVRAAAPDVADGERQRVGGVGRPGRGVEPQQARHHRADLVLVGPPGTGDRRLDLARRVGLHRHAGPGGGEHGDGAGLRGAHDGAHVVLAEHPLDGHRVRPVPADERGQRGLQVQQPVCQVVGRVTRDHLEGDEGAGAAGNAVDHADPAPGQTRVDAEHPHTALPTAEPYACSDPIEPAYPNHGPTR